MLTDEFKSNSQSEMIADDLYYVIPTTRTPGVEVKTLLISEQISNKEAQEPVAPCPVCASNVTLAQEHYAIMRKYSKELIEAKATIDEHSLHGPEGRNFTNGQHIALRIEHKSLQARIETLIAAFKIEREGLASERDDAQEDAARYRWSISSDENAEILYSCVMSGVNPGAEIDAAIAEVTP